MHVGPLEQAVIQALKEIQRLALSYADNPVLTVEERKEGFRTMATLIKRLSLAIEHGNDYPEGSYGFVQ